jgi:hypothetical protein
MKHVKKIVQQFLSQEKPPRSTEETKPSNNRQEVIIMNKTERPAQEKQIIRRPQLDYRIW